MFKALKGKKTIKLISYTCLVLFTLAGTVSATVSWFSANRSYKASVDNIAVISKADASDFDLTYRVLKFNDSTKKGVENKVGSNFSFKLDSFDSIIPTRNDTLSQLIEFNITSTQDHPTGGYVIIDLDCTKNFLADGETSKVNPYISNVVKFDSCLYSYTMNDGSAGKTYFTMGNINRYKKAQTGESTPYLDSEPDDKIYQEVVYHLDHDYTSPKVYQYISDSSITSLPDPSTQQSAYLAALATINENKPKKMSMQVDKGMGYLYQLPVNYKTAKFYVRFDYSKVLANFFGKNQNATIYEPTAGGSAVSVLNDIPNVRVRIQANALSN